MKLGTEEITYQIPQSLDTRLSIKSLKIGQEAIIKIGQTRSIRRE